MIVARVRNGLLSLGTFRPFAAEGILKKATSRRNWGRGLEILITRVERLGSRHAKRS
jgi:hypothetical protein